MSSLLSSHGFWQSQNSAPAFDGRDICDVVERVREPMFLVQDPGTTAMGLGIGGKAVGEESPNGVTRWPLLAVLPALYPEWLGDRSFSEVHGTRFPYVSGAMANGIATTDIVIAMGRAGFLGFFGAAGLSLGRVEAAVALLKSELGDARPWGCNLINSPAEPSIEEAVADLYIREGVKRVSAAAYMSLTPAIVRFALSGISQDDQGNIHRTRHVFAKISRPEVAEHFLNPAPDAIIDRLVAKGELTAEEGRLGKLVAVAEDIIVESDSGGHTDNRTLTTLFPSILTVRDKASQTHGYTRPIRCGAAGGLGTPSAVAAAFSLGAAFVLTGSVNQACYESGLDEQGRKMLAEADIADVIMAPAADMFEMGVEVQVLRRGTLFAVRARKLYELYRSYNSLEDIPDDERERVEKQILKATFEEAWESTRAFWMDRDPKEVERAERDPHHKAALVFRAYLGLSSRWAIAGDQDRRTDFQIWCGPAMGAFNRWANGSFLQAPEARSVVQVALNFMEGAAVVTRAQQLRSFGLPVPTEAFDYRPRPMATA
jgi:trans-AT polyketide synthase, acyltransferase and oxidoreductase domains